MSDTPRTDGYLVEIGLEDLDPIHKHVSVCNFARQLERKLAVANAVEPCCGQYWECTRPCTPRGAWLEARKA
jgi:hypothetical protein